MKDAEIMAEYMAVERAGRELIPGNLLLPEDVMTFIEATARRLCCEPETVRQAVIRANSGQGAG